MLGRRGAGSAGTGTSTKQACSTQHVAQGAPQSTAEGMNRRTGVMPQQPATRSDWIRLLTRCSATLKGMTSLNTACSSS